MQSNQIKVKKCGKILALLLVTVLLCPCLFACSSNKKNLRAVGTVGNYDVCYEELRWLTLQYKDLLASTYGKDIWKNSDTAEQYREELYDAVYKSIVSNYAILSLCDDDILKLNGEKTVDINSTEVQDIVQQYVDQTISEAGSKSAYEAKLKSLYMTDHLYRFIYGVDICETLLFNSYCNLTIIDDSDQAAIDYIYKNFIRTVHIYIQNDPKDDVESNRATAEAVRVKLLNGEDINALVAKYSEDKYMTTSDGYYFTHGRYSKAYEDAAFALEIGQVSPVVETYSGFYVIKRMELDANYIGTHFAKELKQQYLLAVFDEIVNKRKAELSFTPNEYGESLDLTQMK